MDLFKVRLFGAPRKGMRRFDDDKVINVVVHDRKSVLEELELILKHKSIDNFASHL